MGPPLQPGRRRLGLLRRPERLRRPHQEHRNRTRRNEVLHMVNIHPTRAVRFSLLSPRSPFSLLSSRSAAEGSASLPPRRNRAGKYDQGFTLLSLMIDMDVIVLLAAIAIPSYIISVRAAN